MPCLSNLHNVEEYATLGRFTPHNYSCRMFFAQVNQRYYEHSHTVPRSIKDSVLIGHGHLPHLYDAPSHLVLPEFRLSHPFEYIGLHFASSALTSIGCAKLTRLRQPKICMQHAWEDVAKVLPTRPYVLLRLPVLFER